MVLRLRTIILMWLARRAWKLVSAQYRQRKARERRSRTRPFPGDVEHVQSRSGA